MLDRNVRRLIHTPNGPIMASLTETGVTLKASRKKKGIHVSYEQLAQYALDKLPHLRWPKHLQNHPLALLHHLGRRNLNEKA